MNLIGDFANGTSEYWKTQNEMCLKELTFLSDEFADDNRENESFTNFVHRWMAVDGDSDCCHRCNRKLSQDCNCPACEEELQLKAEDIEMWRMIYG